MTKPIIRIHDLETNQIIDREMNDDEFAQFEQEQQNELLVQAEFQAEAEAKAAARQAILDRLGLTEDEARLLLG